MKVKISWMKEKVTNKRKPMILYNPIFNNSQHGQAKWKRDYP
jgi:hypothetical protein